MELLNSILQLPWLSRSVLVWLTMLSAAAWCFLARSTRPGYQRFLTVLPALVAMHCCPLLFNFRHEPLAAMSAAFLCVRLTAGKVAAFVLGRGALTLPLSLFQFTAVMLAPFMPAEMAADKVSAPQKDDSAALSSGAGQQKASLAGEPTARAAAPASTAAETQTALGGLTPFMLAGLPHLQTVWQRVSPVQRFSIDGSRSSSGSMSSSNSASSSSSSGHLFLSTTSSPLDSPRIAAVRQQQQDSLADCANSPATSVSDDSSGIEQQQQQRQRQQQRSAPQGAAATKHAQNSSPPAKVQKLAHKPSRLASPATAPPRVSSSRSRSKGQWALQAANLLLNIAVTLAFVSYSCHSWGAARSVATQLSALWFMWRAMELLMWGVSHPARAYLGMTLAPHFVNPFASTSLTDFWARRWNITQGLVLRFYVYEPIIQGCLVAPQTQQQQAALGKPSSSACGDSTPKQQQQQQQQGPDTAVTSAKPLHDRSNLKHRKPSPLSADRAAAGAADASTGAAANTAAAAAADRAVLTGGGSSFIPRWRRQLAAAATFLVSGLEHELFLWYLLRHWDAQWFCFFALQGALLAGEGPLKRACRAAGLQLHPFVSHLAVLLALGVTGDAFFWPPLLQLSLVQPLKAAVPAPMAVWLGVTL